MNPTKYGNTANAANDESVKHSVRHTGSSHHALSSQTEERGVCGGKGGREETEEEELFRGEGGGDPLGEGPVIPCSTSPAVVPAAAATAAVTEAGAVVCRLPTDRVQRRAAGSYREVEGAGGKNE